MGLFIELDSKELKKLNISTRMIRGSLEYDFTRIRSHVPPIFQTVNFNYADVEDGLAVFKGEKSGYFYTRDGNPTSDLFANLVVLLEEGECAIAVASGMAAISSTVLSLVRPGDEIISSTNIYGGTKAWMKQELSSLNIKTDFIDITDINVVSTSITKNTKILFTEVLGSPNLVIADIKKLADIAKTNRLIFIVDNTFSPPPIIQPLKLGADIVIHSATKYLSGHADIIGGVIISEKKRIEKIKNVVKLYGGIISPFNAWLAIRGLKTLALRLEKHNSNALTIAQFLASHPKVKIVHYPGLESHQQHQLAKTQLEGFGGMLAFEVFGGLEAGKKVMNAVKVCNFTTSLGEIDTLIMHPATTSHVSLSKQEREAIGIPDGLMRLSIGIEDVNDLINDLQQALNKI